MLHRKSRAEFSIRRIAASSSRCSSAVNLAYWYLAFVYVDARAQGEGVGTELLRQALAAAQGSPSVLLWVLEENHKARRFYEHFGFSLDGAVHSDPAFLGNDAREVRYQRSLGD